MSVRLVVADDHPVVRAGLVALLSEQPDFDVVGQAGDGQQCLDLVRELEPDLVLMDLRMPVLDGAAATAELARIPGSPPVLILTTYDTDADIVRAVEAGAQGYLLKDSPTEILAGAVRAAVRGETVLAPTVQTRLEERLRRPAGSDPTGRELDVLRLVAEGLSNSEIGARLFIGEATVKTHLIRVFQKLEVDDRTAAVTEGYRRGLIELP